MSKARSLIWSPALLVFWCGCQSNDAPEHLGRLRFETEHFRYYALEGASICENTATWLERVYASLSEYLEVPTQRPNKIDYDWVGVDNTALIEEPCGQEAGGCELGGQRIVTTRAIDPHEMTHAIAAARDAGVSFFAEGLADMLYCGHPQVGVSLDKTQPILPLLTTKIGGDEQSFLARNLARSVVYYLTHRFAKRTFLQFHASLAPDADLRTIASRFSEVFQTPLETVLEDWKAIPERVDETCQYLWECESAAQTGSVDFDTTCGLELRSVSTDAFVPFEIGASNRVEVDARGDDLANAMLSVFSCNGGNAAALALGGEQTRYIAAPAGRYFAWIRSEGRAVHGTLTIENPSLPDGCNLNRDPLLFPLARPLIVSRRWVSSTCAGLPWCPGESNTLLPTADGRLGVRTFLGSDLSITSPAAVYRCDDECPALPESSCRSDSLSFGSSPGQVFSVQGSPVFNGELLHVAAGPINDPADVFAIGYFLEAN